MRPYCVQSTHPMSEHCLYWLVESHTASVLAARLKAVQVCFSARTHTLLLLLLFFNALVVIVVRCACPLEHTLGYLWWRCQQWMRERFLASDVDSYQVHHIPYAQRILQVCFCPLDPALSKCCTPFRLYQEELHCSRCFFITQFYYMGVTRPEMYEFPEHFLDITLPGKDFSPAAWVLGLKITPNQLPLFSQTFK